MKIIYTLLTIFTVSCAPYTITQTGPALDPKSENCDITVLSPGKTPDKPFRDIGMVSLKNCQDYQSGLCLKYLKKAACGLGGSVAYAPKDLMRDGRDDNIAGQITVSVTIATYVSMLPIKTNDPVLNAEKHTSCDDNTSDTDDINNESPEAQMCSE